MRGTNVHDVTIIGSGPAGYTAAIYAARADLAPVVFEGIPSGGALMQTTDVENFPGFPAAVQGPELMTMMREQAERFGATLITDEADHFGIGEGHFTVSGGGHTVSSRTVILATGSRYRMLNVPNETRLLGRGVSACATCDGFFFRDKVVAVAGGGDSAMEEAIFLTRFAERVIVIHRRDQLRASAIMAQRALGHSRIEFLWSTTVHDILGTDAVTGLMLADRMGGAFELRCDGLFVAIGHEPRSELVNGYVTVDAQGYVVVEPHSTATEVAGLFACGDVVDHRYRQAITAAGSGCAAALDAQAWLSENAPGIDRVNVPTATGSVFVGDE
jgi:thioredoxin reductase (NADPH)